MIGLRSSGEGDEERGNSVSGKMSSRRYLPEPNNRIPGRETGRNFEGPYHGQVFFCRTVATSEGMNDGGGRALMQR